MTPDDVQVAKDRVIQMLTNALLRAEAEAAELRREARERDDDGGNDRAASLHGE